MQNIDLKKLNAEDVLLLSSIALNAYSDHYLQLWHDGIRWYTEKCFSLDNFSAELNDPNAIFYLAHYNNSPVGFLKLNINALLSAEEETNCLELERIYLLKNDTGNEVGQELLN